MTIRYLNFFGKAIAAPTLSLILGLIPLGSAVCVLTGCGEAKAIQDSESREAEDNSESEKVVPKNPRGLTYDAIKKYSQLKYGSKPRESSATTKPFKVITDPRESVGSRTSSSPFDTISRQQTPSHVVKTLPEDAKLIGMGRYFCRQTNWKYHMYRTDNGQKVNWSGQEIPKCMSHSGELCLSPRNALYHSFKTRENHFFENLKMHDRGQIQRAIFSSNDQFIVGEDYHKLHIVSAETRRPIQTIENAYFPAYLGQEDRCLYCFDKDKNLLIFVWSGKRFVPLGKKQFTTDERLKDRLTNYLALGDGCVVVAKRIRKQGQGATMDDGLTVFTIDGVKLTKAFEREDWGSLVTQPRTRGSRFAFIRSTGLNKSHWIVYGDAATGKIKQIPFESKRLETYSTYTELDPSGRYFFVKSDGQIQVIRLESN